MAKLGPNHYGKSRIRLVKVERLADRHVLRDATVDVGLVGEFDTAHTVGDNTKILPTDTMKNTVYALAREHYGDAPESFALALARHFLEIRVKGKPITAHVSRAQVRVAENLWLRIRKNGKPHPHAFFSAGAEQRLGRVVATRHGATVLGGIDNLLILKTSGSGFEDFLHDQFTTLPDTSDRIFATAARAVWRYREIGADYSGCWQRARRAALDTFADHDSRSVQHTLYAMGDAMLAACPEIEEIHFVMPNRHHLPVDLARLGMENQNDIFVATTEPYGRIEAVVRRG